jgi:hypothetical protein
MAKRWPYRQPQYASARGRNGRFVPRLLECEFSEAEDGTPLITLRIYSRRETMRAPIELTIAVVDWEIQALAIQLAVNERRRQLASGRHDFANDP